MNEMTSLPEVAPIDRIQENLLARAERRVLNRLCAALPAWVTPDMLTFTGMFGAVLVLAGYLASNLSPEWLWLSVGGYCVHWFGDSLDGSLARFRKIERPRYGYFLDHSCDGLATTMILAGIGFNPLSDAGRGADRAVRAICCWRSMPSCRCGCWANYGCPI